MWSDPVYFVLMLYGFAALSNQRKVRRLMAELAECDRARRIDRDSIRETLDRLYARVLRNEGAYRQQCASETPKSLRLSQLERGDDVRAN